MKLVCPLLPSLYSDTNGVALLEYVAPEKIENILIRSPLIGQCFVHGDSFQSCLVAVVVPDEEPVVAWAKGKGGPMASLSFADICRTDALNEALMADLLRLSKENELNGFETVKAIYVEPNQFTVENDLVTPTFKLKRQKARDYYEAQISDMYANIPPPKSKL